MIKHFYEAAAIDGASAWQRLKSITIPLSRPAMNSIIILSFIGGLRSFDLIWAMTGGGPGYATEVMASMVYKQYAAGYYGLSTAGNCDYVYFNCGTCISTPEIFVEQGGRLN